MRPDLHFLRLEWPSINPIYKTKKADTQIFSEEDPKTGKGLDVIQPEESAEGLPDAQKPVTHCPAPCGDFQQPASLASIVTEVGIANQVTIEIPAWARAREYYLFAGGHSGDEVLQAIAAANGWQIRAVSRDRFRLVRPLAVPPQDGWDMGRQVRGLLPPRVRLLASDIRDHAAGNAERVRFEVERAAITAEVNRAAPEYKNIPLRALSSEWQRRIENFVFPNELFCVRQFLIRPDPPGWLVRPETGLFHLRGRSFEFATPRNTGNPDTSSLESWGWVVGSAHQLPD